MARMRSGKVDKKTLELIDKRQPTIEKCKGCDHDKTKFCECYAFPEAMWRVGNCLRATNIETAEEKAKKKRIGQQKSKSMR